MDLWFSTKNTLFFWVCQRDLWFSILTFQHIQNFERYCGLLRGGVALINQITQSFENKKISSRAFDGWSQMTQMEACTSSYSRFQFSLKLDFFTHSHAGGFRLMGWRGIAKRRKIYVVGMRRKSALMTSPLWCKSMHICMYICMYICMHLYMYISVDEVNISGQNPPRCFVVIHICI